MDLDSKMFTSGSATRVKQRSKMHLLAKVVMCLLYNKILFLIIKGPKRDSIV